MSMTIQRCLAPFLGTRKRWVACLLLVIVGVVYANALGGKFIWDDEFLVQHNAYVQNPLDWPRFFVSGIGAGAGIIYASYRPLQMLSYGLDFLLWGLQPFGFHLSNILLHWGTALVLYRWLRDAFGRPGLAVLSAVLFALHPVHTESVAYISGRADILSALFILLTLHVVCNPKIHQGRRLLLVLTTYTLALLSREGSLILPVLVWLIYRRRDERPNPGIMTGLMVLSGFYLLLRFFVLAGLVPTSPEVSTTLLERLPGALAAFGQYLRAIIWPFDLHMEHGKTVFHWGQQAVLAGGALLVSTLLLIRFLPKNEREIRFGLAWFVLTLLPVLNLYPLNAWFAEHWLYLPFVGIAIVLAESLLYFAQPEYSRFGQVMVMVLALGIGLFWGARTVQQNRYWRDPVYFYRRTIWYAPDSFRLYDNLGKIYFARGDSPTAAAAMYKEAIERNPDFIGAYNNLGHLYAAHFQIREARHWLEETLRRDPRRGGAYVTLIDLAARENDQEAIAAYCHRAEKNGQIGLVRQRCPILPRDTPNPIPRL